MQFQYAFLALFLGLAAAQSTDSATVTTSSLSPTATCLAGCAQRDTSCQAACVAVPNPDAAQIAATNQCEAACPQGNGTQAETEAYAACLQGCVSSYYYASTGTIAAGNTATSASGSAASTSAAAVTTAAEGVVASGSSGAAGTTAGSSQSSGGAASANTESSTAASASSSQSAASTSPSGSDSNSLRRGAQVAGLSGFLLSIFAL
ncbi:hypothetical protein B0A55_01453 [Friedmanniomyces simplex]|uniref:Extracellular membrane protein CFEM domain-containing protein n=1 Tax=Friedmanniomyces simplex TaxID=329884 RepID=A0A4U0XWP0_9PEZI|nr:hypothetical protein B0A55_01453 [Friedmanniomyces simplex]